MKRLITLFLTLVLCVTMCACGSSEPPEPTPSPTPVPTPVPTLSPEELAAKYDSDMASAIGSDDRAPLTKGKAVTYWENEDKIGIYNTNLLSDEWIAETPDEAKYLVKRTEGTRKVGFYYGVGIGGDALQRYVQIQIVNSVTDEEYASEYFYGIEPPSTITKIEDRFGPYPGEEEIKTWILSTLTEASNNAKDSALKDAHGHLDFTEHSKAYLKKVLIEQDGYTPDEADYAVENCGADWKKQALDFTNDLLSTKDYTRSALFEQLTTHRLFTEEEANYALDALNIDWDQMTDKILHDELAESELYYKYSEAALINYLTTYKDYTEADVRAALEAANIDWNAQAMKAAEYMLNGEYGFGYSPDSLVYWLTEDENMGGHGFTKEQAQYAADHIKTDWNKQAEIAAANWVEYWDESIYGELNEENLFWTLTDIDGFTEEQANHGMSTVTIP